MATWKAEFLAHYYEGRRRPLQHYAFGFMDRWAHLASFAPWLANLPLHAPGVKSIAKALAGVAQQREMPAFARSFQAQDRRARRHDGASRQDSGTTGSVLLWPDTWNNYLHPGTLEAAAQVLGSAGFAVEVPQGHLCCGRPLYDFGFLDQARKYLLKILDRLGPRIDAGLPIVVLEPSCASVFQDELVNFFPHDERARRLRQQTALLSEFLVSRAPDWRPPGLPGREIVVHGHCHQKSLMSMNEEVSLLEATGASVNLLDSGCCGMAGPFGFEKEKYSVSQAIGELVLYPALRAVSQETIVVTDGFSCREQILQGTPRRALHLAEVLAGRVSGSGKP